MRLTAKILSWLLGSTLVVMLSFASLAIYMLEKNLRAEALNSHKLIYTLFLPSVTRYLWEFDITGIKETLSNIIENNYANKIYIFDADSTLVTFLYKDPKTGKISNSNNASIIKETENIITLDKKKSLEKKLYNDEENFLYQDNLPNETSRIIGSMLHRKRANAEPSVIGYFVLDYSTSNISNAIKAMIRNVVFLTLCITVMIVFAIGLLLRKTLINSILKLSQASLNISRGKFIKIPERHGSRDEMKDLVKNFNIMSSQIEENQENLKNIAEEGIKISSTFSIEDLAKQISESLSKIAKRNLNTEFYVINSLLHFASAEGFHEILKSEETGENLFLAPDDFEGDPTGKKRFSISDNGTGEVCAIIQISDIRQIYQFSYTAAESVYSAIRALQISVSNALDNMRFVKEQKEQQRLISEQETARLVQNNLMPKSDFRTIGDFELANHFEAADECAGDWWNYYKLTNDRLLLLLGDVTGHGTASALLTAVVKGYCDSIHTQPDITTKAILSQLDSVVRNSGDGNKVMTMFAAVLDPINKTIEFSNAAHNFPITIKKKQEKNSLSKLIAQGKPLGFDMTPTPEQSSQIYEQRNVTLENGDVLIIFSDGLIEALNTSGEEFSERRLKTIILKMAENSVTEIKNEIIKEFREYTFPNKLMDDVTFLVCRYKKIS
ncbi:SpoIIE family protein phosphatase [Fluviispira multicolorata]|uniref:SpoIIE family protein phosphatase n=1 Tax=Fluviispira multicolorata TaxID=2654512 RepID=A0A833N037_9BACT|nr:SpoIIE family protein phosphatase [Fluviispira multicolorata]KAB8027968.1 SpoIIE family protein phosphatase [Fluviispira multicolorata]